ncbi:MAG: methyltransferase domain-containing protein [Spirochaetaceae bacterium]|nr:MAG: methyltransferase domain-containing protein [Spirochaetaceae bacterium]
MPDCFALLRLAELCMSMIKPLVASLERRFAVRPWFFALYALPYRALVARELQLAAVDQRDTVLSIGCGTLPFSAVLAARQSGARVIAVDVDAAAAAQARELVSCLGLSHRITVITADAAVDRLPVATVALVALQAAPKDAIWDNLQRCLLQPNGRAVFRLARPGLEHEYGVFAAAGAAVAETRHRMPTFNRSVLCKAVAHKGIGRRTA